MFITAILSLIFNLIQMSILDTPDEPSNPKEGHPSTIVVKERKASISNSETQQVIDNKEKQKLSSKEANQELVVKLLDNDLESPDKHI
jgi:hypothetical protein